VSVLIIRDFVYTRYIMNCITKWNMTVPLFYWAENMWVFYLLFCLQKKNKKNKTYPITETTRFNAYVKH